jgi:hypothetical protein
MFAVAHRPQMQNAATQSLFAAIEAAGEEIPPQAHAACAATEEPWITSARVFGGARETSHHAVVSRFQRARDAAIPHAQQLQGPRGFFAEDVTCGCRRDALAGKQDNPPRAFGRESSEGPSVRPGQPLARGDPPCNLTAFSGRERAALEVRRIDGIDRCERLALWISTWSSCSKTVADSGPRAPAGRGMKHSDESG